MRRRRNGSGWERRRNVQATDNGSVGKTIRAWSAAGADGRRSLEVARSYGNVRRTARAQAGRVRCASCTSTRGPPLLSGSTVDVTR